MIKAKKKLQLIELNEFSTDLFSAAASKMELPNISWLLSLPHSKTTTEDLIEHRGLDPWVQWVSVHTGVSSAQHEVIHLGDAPSSLKFPQVWEVLSKKGISSGIWGAMNATRGEAESCEFFLPDPWTFQEWAYPEKLNELLALPRYYSKNYLDVSAKKLFLNGFRLLKYVVTNPGSLRILKFAPMLLRGLMKTGLNNVFLFSAFDLVSTVYFIKEKKKADCQLNVIFLNSIAHVQHHDWTLDFENNEKIRFALTVIDRVLGLLRESVASDEALVILNGLTQKNIQNEAPRICYRQINPEKFLSAAGLDYVSVEQLMTNDAHVFFSSVDNRDFAANVLSGVKLNGKPFFHVEPSPTDDNKLFFQIDYWDKIDGEVRLSINQNEVNFSDFFEAIVARTGAHIPEGDVYSYGVDIPKTLPNHDVSKCIVSYFEA